MNNKIKHIGYAVNAIRLAKHKLLSYPSDQYVYNTIPFTCGTQ